MPKINIKDAVISYEIFGEGFPLVYTGTSWFSRNAENQSYYIAGRYAKIGCKVLLWDRPNTGESDFIIENFNSEWDLWAETLNELLKKLDMKKVYLAGNSSGNVMNLLYTNKYPDNVKALIINNVSSDNFSLYKKSVLNHYLIYADIAEKDGMQAVIDYSDQVLLRFVSGNGRDGDFFGKWIAEVVNNNHDKYKKFLKMNPKKVADIFRKWARWHLSEKYYLGNLTNKQISNIRQPAIIAHGFDEIHPEHTAKKLHSLLENSVYVDFSKKYTNKKITEIKQSDSYWTQSFALPMDFNEDFILAIEKNISIKVPE